MYNLITKAKFLTQDTKKWSSKSLMKMMQLLQWWLIKEEVEIKLQCIDTQNLSQYTKEEKILLFKILIILINPKGLII